MFAIKNYFPFPEIREQQQIAINFILDTFQSNKKFVVLEAATGVGKSGLAVCVARYLNNQLQNTLFEKGAYFLTTQKILQEQYAKDFGPPCGTMVSLKSSSNYLCNFHNQLTCKESRHLLQGEPFGTQFSKSCLNDCVYIKDKLLFNNSFESITSYAYFLTSTLHNKSLKPRNLLVVDEAHNIENQISNNYELTISENFCKKILKINWQKDLTNQAEVLNWICEVYAEAVTEHLSHLLKMFNKYRALQDRSPQLTNTAKQYDMIVKHNQKIQKFIELYSEDNWALNLIPAIGKSMRKFEFKPIDISQYVHDILFPYGNKVLLMSATILNKDAFCESLGIKNEDCGFLSLETPFPIQNRPVFYMPCGKMSKDKIDESLPKIAQNIKNILNIHKNEKGLIHCHTFRIADFLRKNIKNKRLLFHDSENREEVLLEHIKSNKPTVLVSPSMSEGVDLKDDSSRFQILCKIPYPYLGCQITKKRMKKFKHWYNYQTAKSIIQSLGRSIRHIDDSAVSYILDEDWDYFYKRNSHLFPPSFKKTLQN